MAKKPTYEELEQRVKEFENEAFEHKQVEEALRESEEKYRSLLDDVVDSTNVGIFILDSDFKVVWVNQALELHFGLQREEVVGRDKRQLILKKIKHIFEDPDSFMGKVLATYDDNTYVENFECHVLSGDKREDRWLEHWSKPIRSGLYTGGRVELYYDITERKHAEEALSESEERYKALFQRSLEMVYLCDFEGNFIDANDAALELLGYTKEHIKSLNFVSLLDNDQLPLAFETAEEIVKTGSQRELTEYKLRRKDGEHIFVESKGALIYRYGKPYAIQGIARDITDRKLAEEELRESEARFRGIFENSYHAIALSDPKGQLTLYNDRSAEMLGYRPEELVGKNVLAMTHPEDEPPSMDKIKMLIEGKIDSYRLEKRYVCKDGSVFWADLSIKPILDANGEIDALVAIIVDINDRKMAEEALRESEKRFRAIFEQAAVGVGQFETETGRILRVNQRYCEIVGYTQQEITGTTLMEITHPDDVQLSLDNIQKLIRGETQISAYEKRYIRRDGSIIWVNITISPMWSVNEKPTFHIGIVEDITSHKQAEEALRESKEDLAKAQNVAHIGSWSRDLNTDQVHWSDEMYRIFGLTPGVLNTPHMNTSFPAYTRTTGIALNQ